MATNCARATGRITRPDIPRLLPIEPVSVPSESRPEPADPRRQPEDAVPAVPSYPPAGNRPSSVRLKHGDVEVAFPFAAVDVVTADMSRDPRREP